MTAGTIGIVGYGVVGRSVHSVFGDDAICLDADATDEDRRRINACPITFVCVPTPTGADGQCDTVVVEECVAWIRSPIIVLRSTVSPGTTDALREKYAKRVVFQPEYIGETPQHPLADARSHNFVILGGAPEDCSVVADVYQRYYHSEVRFYFTDSRTAEVAKYMENSFYAVKVTFCNEFYDIAKAHGVDYNELREVWLADPRISRDHTFVYPDSRGFSGKCLPKDVSAIIHACHRKGMLPRLLECVMDINETCRDGEGTYEPYRRRNRSDAATHASKTGIPVGRRAGVQ